MLAVGCEPLHISFFPAAAQRQMHSRLKDIPERTKQAATPTVPLEVRNTEGTYSSRCAKKRCKVAKGRGKGVVFSTLHCLLHDGNSEVSCGLTIPQPSVMHRAIFSKQGPQHTFAAQDTLLVSFLCS